MPPRPGNISSPEDVARAVVRAADGDSAAWEALYEHHADKLWHRVNRMTRGDLDVTAEVMQETWLQVAQRLETFDPERGSFLSWATKIAEYKMLNYFRTTTRYRDMVVRASMLTGRPITSSDDTPELAAEAIETRQQLVEQIMLLPRRQADALMLTFYEDLTIAEAAAEMGCSEGNVRLARYRGLMRLKLVLRGSVSPSGISSRRNPVVHTGSRADLVLQGSITPQRTKAH